jgi:hypothetical protein
VQRDWIAQAGALAEFCRDVAAIGLAAEALDLEALERQSRQHHDAVIALLPVERGVLVAEPPESLQGEFIVGTLGFLQAQNVGPHGLEEARHEIDAQPHRIDVPAGDSQFHRDQGVRNHESGVRRDRENR